MTCALASFASSSEMRPSMKPCALARRVVLGVLGEVAVRARLADRRGVGRPLDGLQPVQLVAQQLGAALGHGGFHVRRTDRVGASLRMQVLQAVGLEAAPGASCPAQAALAPAMVV